MRLRILTACALFLLASLAVFVAWWPATNASTSVAPSEAPVGDGAPRASAPVSLEAQTTPTAEDRVSGVVDAAPAKAIVTLLRVLVVDENQLPLADWRARVVPDPLPSDGHGTRPTESARGTDGEEPITNEDGRVEFAVRPALTYELSAWPEAGHGGHAEDVRVSALVQGETREVVVHAKTRPDLAYFVRALDRDTRSPLAGIAARVRATRNTWRLEDEELRPPVVNRLLGEGVTDATGIARLDVRTYESPYLELEGRGRSRAVAPIRAGHSTPETALDVLLDLSARLEGTLVGATGGDVLLRTEGYELAKSESSMMIVSVDAGEQSWSAEVGPDGRFVFEDLPVKCTLRAEWWESARAGRRLGESVQLAPAETRTVVWQLGGTCTVRGHVLDSADAPIADVEVWLVPDTSKVPHVFEAHSEGEAVVGRARTDERGAFVLSEVRVGAWQIGIAVDREIRVLSSTRDFTGLSACIEVGAGDALREVVLRVDRGLYLTGVVRGPDGKTQVDAYVLAVGLEKQGFFGDNVGDGAFRLGPMVRGRYSISATSTEHAPSAALEAEAGAKDLVLELQAGASISGRVVDSAGAPGPFEIQLTASEGSTARFTMTSTSTFPDGSYSFEGLEPGAYDVVARNSGGRHGVQRSVQARAGAATKGVDLVLDAGARLRIKSASVKGLIRVSSDGALIHMLRPEADASLECSLPPGKITVELVEYVEHAGQWKLERLAKESLDIGAGETKELVIEAPK